MEKERADKDVQNTGDMKQRASCKLLWLTGRWEHANAYFSECMYKYLSACCFFFFLKVGQDKLQASTHVEQHPHARHPGSVSVFFQYTFSSTYPYFSYFGTFALLSFLSCKHAFPSLHPWASPSLSLFLSPLILKIFIGKHFHLLSHSFLIMSVFFWSTQ